MITVSLEKYNTRGSCAKGTKTYSAPYFLDLQHLTVLMFLCPKCL